MVQTGSMEPHISPGDAAVIAPWDMMDLVPVGGVVQFRSPAAAEPDGVERLRLHRIVETNDDGTFVTAGDANRDVDSSPLRRDQIAGQARVLVPFIGLPGFWLGTGQFAKLAAWAGLTLLALVLVIGGSGRWPPQAMQLEQDAEPARQQVDRRAVLALAALAAAGGMVGTRLQPSAASFTTSTGTKASWSVASLPKLTLGRASTYVLLAHDSIVNAAFLGIGTQITGNVARSPGTSIVDFWSWEISGSADRNTAGARNAKSDLLALYAALEKYPATESRGTTLSGTLTPEVYTSSTGKFIISGTLTLDAQGDPSARFIFRAASISAASGSSIALPRGAQSDNIYWRSTGEIDLGSSSTSRGVYLANANAAVQSNGRLTGRLYSCTGTIKVTRATIAAP